ncbi:hypothetical protein [Stutzerimonas stutzeri]|uniref:hypothetical protein n=1 Tax=Stutzerimonas stutzeri TaxID=316 RepID=UPI0034D73FB3
MTIETGGPAFPVPLNPGERYAGHATQYGMTLRDYLAAKAMQSLMRANGLSICHPSTDGDNQAVAKVAYAMADAMLTARTS